MAKGIGDAHQSWCCLVSAVRPLSLSAYVSCDLSPKRSPNADGAGDSHGARVHHLLGSADGGAHVRGAPVPLAGQLGEPFGLHPGLPHVPHAQGGAEGTIPSPPLASPVCAAVSTDAVSLSTITPLSLTPCVDVTAQANSKNNAISSNAGTVHVVERQLRMEEASSDNLLKVQGGMRAWGRIGVHWQRTSRIYTYRWSIYNFAGPTMLLVRPPSSLRDPQHPQHRGALAAQVPPRAGCHRVHIACPRGCASFGTCAN